MGGGGGGGGGGVGGDVDGVEERFSLGLLEPWKIMFQLSKLPRIERRNYCRSVHHEETLVLMEKYLGI